MIELQRPCFDDKTVDSIIDAAVNIDVDSTLGAVRATLGTMQPESIDLCMNNPLGVLMLTKDRSSTRLRGLLPDLMKTGLLLEQTIWSRVETEEEAANARQFSQLVTTFSHVLYPPEDPSMRHGHFSIKKGVYDFSPQDVSRHGRKIEGYNYKSPADVITQIYERHSHRTLLLDSFPVLSTDYGERFSYLNGTQVGFAKQHMIGNCRDGRRYDEISTALEEAKKYEMRPHLLIGLSDENGECLSSMRCDLGKIKGQLGFGVYSTSFPQFKTFMPIQNVPITAGSSYLAEVGRDFETLDIKPGYRLKACHGEADQIDIAAFASVARAS